MGDSQFQIIYQIPMQFALQIIHFVFIVAEDVFGILSLRVLAKYQISRFHYKQFDSAAHFVEKDSNPNDEMDWLYNLERMNGFKMKSLNQEYQV